MILIFLTNKYSNKGILLFNILDNQLTSHKVNRCRMFYCRHLMPTITVMAMINMLILIIIIWVILILLTTLLHIHNSPFSFQDKAIQWIILLRFYIWLINSNLNLRILQDNRNFSNINRFKCNSSSNSRIIWMAHRILRIMGWFQRIIRKRMILNQFWINSSLSTSTWWKTLRLVNKTIPVRYARRIYVNCALITIARIRSLV